MQLLSTVNKKKYFYYQQEKVMYRANNSRVFTICLNTNIWYSIHNSCIIIYYYLIICMYSLLNCDQQIATHCNSM